MESRNRLLVVLLVAIVFASVFFLASPSSDLCAECPKRVLPNHDYSGFVPSSEVKEEARDEQEQDQKASGDADQVTPQEEAGGGGTAVQVQPSLRPAGAPLGQLPWADMLHASEPCQEGPISVAWVMKDHLAGSHLWSGWDICDGINGNYANGSKRFPDIVCLPLLTAELESKSPEQVLDLFRKEGQPPEKRNVDLCVFLKGAERDSINRCRKLGAKTALMYVDGHPNMLNDGGIHDYVLPNYDHVVVPNTLMSQHYAQVLGGSRVWVIPQQNPNVNRVIKTNAADPVRVVAWQGSPENRMSPEVRDAITAWTNRNPGIEFREIFFRAPGQTRAGQEQARDQAFKDVVRQADVLVIFPPQAKFIALEVYKPSGRNLFSLSMGIPSILLPYVSYTEDNKWGANYPAFASNIPQLLRWLDILRDSAEARVTLSRMALEWADHFSMDHIAMRWAYHIRSATCGKTEIARVSSSSSDSDHSYGDHSPASRTATSWLDHLCDHLWPL